MEFIDPVPQRRFAQALQHLVQTGGLARARVSAEVHQARAPFAQVAGEKLPNDRVLLFPREHLLLALLRQAPLRLRVGIGIVVVGVEQIRLVIAVELFREQRQHPQDQLSGGRKRRPFIVGVFSGLSGGLCAAILWL